MNERAGRVPVTLAGPAGYLLRDAGRLGTLAGQDATMVPPARAAPRRLSEWRSFPSGSTVVPMSTPHPHSLADLALAPVLIGIERNLARLRDGADLEFALALALNDDRSWYHSAAERARRVLQAGIREVDLHGWTVSPTPDWHGLAVSHGEYSVPVMLGRRLTGYIEHGVTAVQPVG
jgi:hypothetical protein